MSSHCAPRLACVALLAVGTAFAPLGSARAAEVPVAGGRLDWGIKASFTNYVTGPIADGSWELTGGAATVGADQFRFHTATGDYDSADGTYTASYSGGVHFTGHRQDDGSFEMDLTIANPTVEIAGGAGTIYVDMTDPSGTAPQVPFGKLGLSGLDTSGAGGSVAISDIPVTLTEQGAAAFAGYYSAGEIMDPLSLTGDLGTDDSPSPDDKSDKDDSSADFTRAAVDWGVRRTFREYVVGDIAQGEWRLSDGAQDGGAIFRFPDGEGERGNNTLAAKFAGTLSFIGQDLDLSLDALTVSIKDEKGTLSANVTSDGDTDKKVSLVTFAAQDVEPVDGLLLWSEIPTTLTDAGADALAGFYPTGTEMDPLTLAIPLEADAALPPLPDIGQEPSATQPAQPAAEETAATERSWLPIVIGAIAAVLALVIVVVLVARRRRRTEAAGTAAGTRPDAASAASQTEPESEAGLEPGSEPTPPRPPS